MLIPFECTKADINNLRLRAMYYEKQLNDQNIKVFKHAQYNKEGESKKFYEGIINGSVEKS